MKEKYLGLCIDDDAYFSSQTKKMFMPDGLELRTLATAEEGLQMIKKNHFSFVMLDLNFKHSSMQGYEALEEIKKINESIPVFLTSAYLGDIGYEKDCTVYRNVDEIKKPIPMRGSKKYKDVIRGIYNKAAEYELYNMSHKQFVELSDKNRAALNNAIYEDNRDFVKKYFLENKDKKWVVIAGGKGQIIESGKSAILLESDMFRMSKKINKPVFCYVNSNRVEELNKWSNFGALNPDADDDMYPVVTMQINGHKVKRRSVEATFDTGSPYTFLNYDKFYKEGVLKKRIFPFEEAGILWGKRLSFYSDKIRCCLLGSNGEGIEIDILCRLVMNWHETSLADEYERDASVGRNVLCDNKLRILLDGNNRITDIIK
jgi:CheY-like chemotaxis protein